jgi:hypothetical protein
LAQVSSRRGSAFVRLLFLSFDPFMFDRHGSGRNPRNMDLTDLDQVVEPCGNVDAALVLQLSTYSANNNNPQSAVREVVVNRLRGGGLQEVAVVRADGNMMSLVFVRSLDAVTGLDSLPARFDAWLQAVKEAAQPNE